VSTYAKGDPVARAFAAWFRSADDGIHDQPSIKHSGVVEHEGRQYVLLENGYRTLAVYRIRPDGVLKGLKRPPKELAPDWYTERAATDGEDSRD
jgi:hypothetical protein